MAASRKARKLKAANDTARRKKPARVATIITVPTPKAAGRVAASGILVLGFAFIALTIAMVCVESPPPAEKFDQAHRTKPATDLRVPASRLTPSGSALDDPAVASVAQLIDAPAVKKTKYVAVKVEEDASGPEAGLGQAHHFLQDGDITRALHSYEQIAAKAPHNRDALAGLIYLYARQGDYPQALAASRRLLQDNPGDAEAAANLAHILQHMNKIDEAIVAMDKAARLAPASLSYRFELAILYDRHGDTKEALSLYNQVLEATEEEDNLKLPVVQAAPQIAQRMNYLERSSDHPSADPSTTSPVDN